MSKNTSAPLPQNPSAQSKITSFIGGSLLRWTPERTQVLTLLKKGLSVPQIAKSMNITERAVRHHTGWLVKNHQWSTTSVPLPETVPVAQDGSTTPQYRVHDFILSLPVHGTSDTFKRAVKEGNIRFRDGHHVQLYPKNVTIRGKRGFSFYGVDTDDALAQAHEYWTMFIKRIEGWYGVLLLKRDSVFQMSYEVAETDNDLAKQQAQAKDWVRVRTTEDGTTWLVLDHSDSYEVDATHRRTSGFDMQRVVAPMFNNLRDNPDKLRLPTEAWAMHDELLAAQLRLAGEVRALQVVTSQLVQMQASFFGAQGEHVRVQTELLKSQLPKPQVVNDLDSGIPREWLL